jgi:hypothetical protein
LVFLGFVEAKSNTSFVYYHDADTIPALYVNDITITTTQPELLQSTTTAL